MRYGLTWCEPPPAHRRAHTGTAEADPLYIDDFIRQRLHEATERLNAGLPDPVVQSAAHLAELRHTMRWLESNRRVDGKHMRELAALWSEHPDYRADEWRPGESFEEIWFGYMREIKKAKAELRAAGLEP